MIKELLKIGRIEELYYAGVPMDFKIQKKRGKIHLKNKRGEDIVVLDPKNKRWWGLIPEGELELDLEESGRILNLKKGGDIKIGKKIPY